MVSLTSLAVCGKVNPAIDHFIIITDNGHDFNPAILK